MTLVETIRDLVEEAVNDTPYFLVDIVQGERSRKIQVLIDGDEGISIDQCSKVSRAVSKVVDEEDFEADPFILEVSSPGADLPLKNQRQYPKHIGRTLLVKLADSERKIKLSEVTETGIVGTLVREGKKKKNQSDETLEIPFTDIIETTVVLSFK